MTKKKKKFHCHIHIRGMPTDKYGNQYAIDTYGGNGSWQSTSFAKTKDEAKKIAKRIRYYIKKND